MAAGKKKDGEQPANFESTTKRLGAIVETLEDESIPLEQALQAFEEGIQLVRQAQVALTDAEQRVNMLVEEDGQPISSPLNADGSTE